VDPVREEFESTVSERWRGRQAQASSSHAGESVGTDHGTRNEEGRSMRRCERM
jgi:hypothetical protein